MAGVYRSQPRALGERRARYASPPPVRGTLLMLVVFGLPGLMLVGGFQSAPGEVFAGDRATNALLGVALLALAGFGIRALVKKATLRVDEHDNGLLWVERGLPRKITWDDIVEVRGAHVRRTTMSVEVARTSVYRLTLEGGHVLVVSTMLGGVERLMDRIEREVGERVLSRARTAIEQGGTAAFGPVQVTKEAISFPHAKKTWPWSGVTSVDVSDGVLSFHGDREAPAQRVDVPWADVPNANALLTLVKARLAPPPA